MWEPAVCSRGSGSWMVHGWSGSGTGMERYGTGSGTKRPTPAQLCHHEAHLYQNWQCGARVAQQAILRLLDCQLATAKRISTIKHHSCATAGSNCKWCRRKPATGWEGGRVTSNPFLDCQLTTAKHIPTITQQTLQAQTCQHNHRARA